LGLAVGFFALFALTAVLVEVRSSVSPAAATVPAAALVALLSWRVRPVAALASAGLGWLFMTTFLVDRTETLRWHGSGDLVRLLALFATAAGVSAVRSGQLAIRGRYLTVPLGWVDEHGRAEKTDDARLELGG
jgi:hypothetical protein